MSFDNEFEDAEDLPLIETANNHLWRRSLLTPFKARIDDLYSKAQIEGTVDSVYPPEPSATATISESTMRALLDCLHWAPYEWTDKWVKDTYWYDFAYYGDEDSLYWWGDLNYHREVLFGYSWGEPDWYQSTTQEWLWQTQPHVELLQLWDPNIITGAKLDWISRDYFFNNDTGVYNSSYGAPSIQFIWDYYNKQEPNFYNTLTSYPIEDDGTCNLTWYDHPTPWYNYSTETTWDVGYDTYERHTEVGDASFSGWQGLALNLEDAVFI